MPCRKITCSTWLLSKTPNRGANPAAVAAEVVMIPVVGVVVVVVLEEPPMTSSCHCTRNPAMPMIQMAMLCGVFSAVHFLACLNSHDIDRRNSENANQTVR
jgi:hypothetical protein